MAHYTVPDTDVERRNYSVGGPWLQPEEQLVLQFHHPKGVHRCRRVHVEYVIVE